MPEAPLPTRRARRGPARGGGRALAHLDAHPLRAAAARVALAGPDRGRRDGRLPDRHRGRRARPAVLRPDRRDHHAGHHRRPARPARGRARARRRGRDRGRRRARPADRAPGAARSRSSCCWRWAPPCSSAAARSSPPRPRSPPSSIAVLQPPGDGFSGARFVDALIGGGVALLVNSLLLPADPVKLVRRAAEPVLDELALTLERIADAIEAARARRPPSARCCGRASSTSSRPTCRRRSPSAARPPASRPRAAASRGTVDFYADAAAQIDLAIRNVRVLARGARARRAAGREPAAGGRRRRSATSPRPSRALREALDRPGARRRGARRPRCTPPRRPPACSRRPATCRSPSSSARSARPPSTCCAAPA